MQARSITHIAICVRDMERALVFYRDILGMQVTLDRVEDTTQGGLPHIHKHDRKTRRTVHLRYGDWTSIPSLVLTSHPEEEPDGAPIKLDQVGISHFSFRVENVETLAKNLISKGVKLAAPLEAFTRNGKTFTIFVYDPDGILIQFDGGAGG